MKKFAIIVLFLTVSTLVSFSQNVGIGISAPLAKLEIGHSSTVTSPTLSLLENLTGNYSRLQFANLNSSRFWHIAGAINSPDADSRLNFYYSSPTTGDVMTLTGDGKVGIGMTPSAKFDVAGNARANSFQYSVARPFYYSLNAADFTSILSSSTTFTDEKLVNTIGQNGVFTNGPGVVASVHLPHGATILSFTVYFTDNSAENLNVQLVEYDPVSDLNTVMGEMTSTGTPNKASLSVNSISLNTVNNITKSYRILAQTASRGLWPSSALVVRSISFTYTLTEAQ